jgi:hypothetical protein
MALIVNADIQGQEICLTEATADAAITLTRTAKRFRLDGAEMFQFGGIGLRYAA